jgi:hypothetical protein
MDRWTVCVLEPCCEVSAPWYVGTGRCFHIDKRTPVVTVFDNEGTADQEAGKIRGHYSLGGWIVRGDFPEPGFRVQPVGGSSVHGHFYGAVSTVPFPTVEAAEKYAEDWNEWTDGARRKLVLYNVTDTDGMTVWSSFGARTGWARVTGDMA